MSAEGRLTLTEGSVGNSFNRQPNSTVYSSQHFIFNKSLIYIAYYARNYITYLLPFSIEYMGNAGLVWFGLGGKPTPLLAGSPA